MFAVLEFSDLLWIWVIVTTMTTFFVWGRSMYSGFQPSQAARMRRIEAKLDLILRELNLDYKDPATPDGLSEEVKALADDPARKIAAIKLLREQTGIGLKEAKDAIEAYMAGK